MPRWQAKYAADVFLSVVLLSIFKYLISMEQRLAKIIVAFSSSPERIAFLKILRVCSSCMRHAKIIGQKHLQNHIFHCECLLCHHCIVASLNMLNRCCSSILLSKLCKNPNFQRTLSTFVVQHKFHHRFSSYSRKLLSTSTSQSEPSSTASEPPTGGILKVDTTKVNKLVDQLFCLNIIEMNQLMTRLQVSWLMPNCMKRGLVSRHV